MQFTKVLLILDILRTQVLRKVGLAHISYRLVQGEPIQFPHQFLDILTVEVAGSVDALLNLDDEGEVVLLTFGNVADEQVVGKEAHC